ncbi:transmembrane protein 45b [Plakobranchus ocellatus]|uniref:Transmembrane protein 45b n=1 Tax=Plakobranchus ocellatus TaxID=259542 RepID=A0AAV4AF29_9GAST|nr:transmembrane protein 45b [Plakobranchus ocellatus]
MKGCRTLWMQLPMEAMVKILFSLMGVGIEIGHHWPPPLPSRIVQHCTMYAFFLLAGVIDAASHLGAPLPDGLQYVSMALALSVEGLLFASHVHGREALDIHIHMLLVKVIAVTVIMLLLEARFRKSPIVPLTRAFLLMLQGTWFWAIAVILYKHGEGHPTNWDLGSPRSLMLATIYFSWHCAVIFILLLVMNLAMGYYILKACATKQEGPASSSLVKSTHKKVQESTTKDYAKYSIFSASDDADDDDENDDEDDDDGLNESTIHCLYKEEHVNVDI